ncbi:hypothetical protein ACWCPQ_27870 [Nocardia sp. NPDC001965]
MTKRKLPPVEEKSDAVVNAIIHGIGIADSIEPGLAAHIAADLLSSPLWSLTPDEEYRAIADALSSGQDLGDRVGARFSDGEIRGLLVEISDHMDEARPWPDSPFSILSGVESEYFPIGPIARLDISWPRIEGELGKTFSRSAGGRQYLAVRLRSGAEIAFVWSPGESGTSVMSADRDLSASAVIDEIIDATDLTHRDFIHTR